MAGYEVVEERVDQSPTRVIGDDLGRATREVVTTMRRQTAPPPPPLAWYESLPTWVSISFFFHGLVLLLLVAVLGSPGSFGIASEGSVERATTMQAVEQSALQGRVAALEQLVASSRAAALQPTDQLTQQISQLETRVGVLCARANPPC